MHFFLVPYEVPYINLLKSCEICASVNMTSEKQLQCLLQVFLVELEHFNWSSFSMALS